MRPPIAYYGSKVAQASRIAALLPKHSHYVEPFAGSLAVLLAKPRSGMETVNDIDGDLMTFWRVLRDRPEEFEVAMRLTPHSRAEQAAAFERDETLSDLERARRVWVLLSQSRGATLRRTGWRHYRDPSGSTYSMPDRLAAYADRVPPAAERLFGVSLECRDALEVIRKYGQHPDVLLYCDPPYLGTSRSSRNYRHEMASDVEHRALAETLQDCRASVVLSGYRSPLYDDLFSGWDRVEATAWTGNGVGTSGGRVDGERTEVLWSNRSISDPDLFSVLEAS